MDKIDRFYIEHLLKNYEVGKWYKLIEVLETDMDTLVNRLYILERRGAVRLVNKPLYAEILKRPDWVNMSFKLLKLSPTSKYYFYLDKSVYLPSFPKIENKPKQLKLEL